LFDEIYIWPLMLNHHSMFLNADIQEAVVVVIVW
jgi:hypothetical protein